MAYQVNIIQIPVPVTGDCTLHLLTNTELKKVEHAVLMDGGLAGTVANIGKAFKNAAATFGDIKLDAIVITHWDADHYQGTQHFFDHKENPANREKYLKTTNKKDQSGKSFVEIGTILYCSTDGDEAIDFRQRIAPEPDSWKASIKSVSYFENLVLTTNRNGEQPKADRFLALTSSLGSNCWPSMTSWHLSTSRSESGKVLKKAMPSPPYFALRGTDGYTHAMVLCHVPCRIPTASQSLL